MNVMLKCCSFFRVRPETGVQLIGHNASFRPDALQVFSPALRRTPQSVEAFFAFFHTTVPTVVSKVSGLPSGGRLAQS